MPTLTDADKVLRNDTGKAIVEKLETANALLASIASGEGGIKLQSFKDLQYLTRLGLANKILSIGSQIEVERATETTATIGNDHGTAGITGASVVRDTFLAKIGVAHNGDYEFTYDGAAWHFENEAVELIDYGITATGTPAVGDEIVIHEKATSILFDVIGIDCEEINDPQFSHSVTLLAHDCFTSLQFDAREAFLAVIADAGLAAGTYHFKVIQQPWYAGDVNKSFQFTLANALPKGGQIVFDGAYNATLNNTTAKVYSGGSSAAVVETVTIIEGATGADLGELGNAFNLTGSTVSLNSIQRAFLGSNRWKESALRQYLNSDKAAGSVWAPQNIWDRAPSWSANTAGFLNGMDLDFVSTLGEVKKRTALNTVCDGGGSEVLVEKVFLVSRSEVFGNFENSIEEGAVYPYYGADYSDYSSKNDGADSNRIKFRAGAAQYWWLRTCYSSIAYGERFVYASGGIDVSSSSYSYGVAPACVII